ncbi:MAG: hypothetical protein CVV05_02090 [Gammaproteobacteria bacterium HGW-Gammaproteobacteria-1]|nr:MAG: hypothetical protein CVV05_02090 [Gammaproteobacteria bacterium HGW-Gammaproteobacteria-1]
MKFAGTQPAVVWQVSHWAVVTICPVDLPVAELPLWQVLHEPVTPSWLKVAGIQPPEVWQVSHCAVVAICRACLPVAWLPLWQVEQVPLTPL